MVLFAEYRKTLAAVQYNQKKRSEPSYARPRNRARTGEDPEAGEGHPGEASAVARDRIRTEAAQSL